jgi:hypothetical protein
MRSTESTLRVARVLLFSVTFAGLAACGGGGGSGNAGSGSSTSPGPTGGGNGPTPTRTPSRQSTLPGQVGTPTPTPPGGATPTGTAAEEATPVEITVPMNGDIRGFARNAPAGATLILMAGSYRPVDLQPGDLKGPLTITADVTGELTGGPTAPALVNAGNKDAAFRISGNADLTIDGLTLVGGNVAALLVEDSSGVSVLDCTMRSSHGDGARFERSPNGFLFNSLIYNNAGTGIRVLGTDSLFIINNTVYNSKASGLYLGLSVDTPSSNAFVENNIFNKNTPTGITVDTIDPSSLDGYFADFNLNSDGYGPGTPRGENDVNGLRPLSDPQFVFQKGPDDFHLSQTSPAVNAGDFDTDPSIVDFLGGLSTQEDGTYDTPPVDLGYHYVVLPTPTPRP